MPLTTSETKEKMKTEAELRQLSLDLIQSNKLLKAEVAERKRVEAEILEVTLAEQRRFGSQLHDGLCQELTAILVFSKALAEKMEKNNTLELAELKKISNMLLYAVDQARDTARGLYPGELEGESLMYSLEELVSRTTGALCVFHCPEPILIDDNNIATHLYRIVQEGISNAIKHGKAKNIEVSLTRNKEIITLSIKDDGIGMMDDLKDSKGIGLKIMKYRAHMMNASFHIKPNLPQGSLLECHLKRPANQRSVV
ncbi:MAG: hypothetical protein A3I05_02860 [Deltaproteobacteria bacterium RIFCSPLOWO2_02_FULL_44_10]|nr:MAG: hypothetical protein A3C46_03520 [Deltaproteobacteria bacterium RIFCSPHIGHO2_02_FULL_44_16]OGQ46553.1 MAG: hypothetical protein A3I05_02860 [Deltaproteobacteria bacterium RIFCSPLOWO2_02_FULL_44_10]